MQITKISVLLVAIFGLSFAQLEHHKEEKHHEHEGSYEFKYGVEDAHTGDYHTHHEHKHGKEVSGVYTLKEADGTTRVVKYHAGPHSGFNAVVERIGHAHHPIHHKKIHESLGGAETILGGESGGHGESASITEGGNNGGSGEHSGQINGGEEVGLGGPAHIEIGDGGLEEHRGLGGGNGGYGGQEALHGHAGLGGGYGGSESLGGSYGGQENLGGGYEGHEGVAVEGLGGYHHQSATSYVGTTHFGYKD